MTTLEDYRSRYAHVRFDRDDDGIMVVTLHSDGGPMQWGEKPHQELAGALYDVGRDRANRVVILTGAGDVFVGPKASKATRFYTARPEGEVWEAAISEDFHIVMNHVNIEVPVIAAVNGPAFRRSELALLADVVLCTPDASFEDSHFEHSELVPGDGLGLIMMDLLGTNRGRYHLLTGAPVPAQQALALGLVAEIVERKDLLPRAHEIARHIAAKPPLVVRGTRAAITQRLKRLLASELHSGMFIEGFSGMAKDY